MTINCKGCGEELNNLYCSLSRYGHGDICVSCGVAEAFNGNFIKKYPVDDILGVYPYQQMLVEAR